MSSNLIRQVKKQQEKIQDLQKEMERNSGRKEQLLKQLKEEFDVSSKEEAQSLLVEYMEVRKENVENLEKIQKELDEIIAKAENNSRKETGARTIS